MSHYNAMRLQGAIDIAHVGQEAGDEALLRGEGEAALGHYAAALARLLAELKKHLPALIEAHA